MSSRPAALPTLVAITGGSGSGKSWLAEKLATALAPNSARLSLDDFFGINRTCHLLAGIASISIIPEPSIGRRSSGC